MQLQTLIDTNGPTTSIQSISLLVWQKVYFLGWHVGGFKASDDDPMISATDP